MSENTTESITRGTLHVGLTVPDLEAIRKFFLDTLGYDQVGEIPDYPAVFLSDESIMTTLWQATDPVSKCGAALSQECNRPASLG